MQQAEQTWWLEERSGFVMMVVVGEQNVWAYLRLNGEICSGGRIIQI